MILSLRQQKNKSGFILVLLQDIVCNCIRRDRFILLETALDKSRSVALRKIMSLKDYRNHVFERLSKSNLSVVLLSSCRVFHVYNVSGYSKGTNSATPRGTWLRLVRDATEISHLREAILTLEETLRGLQAGEDKIEGGRMGMINMIYLTPVMFGVSKWKLPG